MLSAGIFDPLRANRGSGIDFKSIAVSLASPECIRSWSYGEIRLPETTNYRTFKPEPGGLFCAKIFGPIKDYECLCGRYKRIKNRNIVCEKCGVEVTTERVRRERMGHIKLACPVAHILFFKSLPSRIGLMLDLTMRNIERILYFEVYVVLSPKRVAELERGQILTPEEYQKHVNTHGEDSFKAGIGAEGLRDYLKSIDLDELTAQLREEMDNVNAETKRKKLAKRLKLANSFRLAKLRPEWMILEYLPVLPPSLRPLVPLESGRLTTSDLNELYRRVINRNNRLSKLIDLDAPEIIINNEKRMLQEAVDSLLDNGRRGKPVVTGKKRPLKSLADIVKGKAGRFRQNLLGKRVDFSARSVIVVGPNLKLHQCGLPKEMALVLFRPFVYNVLVNRGLVTNTRQARQRVDAPDAEVWDIVEEVISQHPVLLNRAPTLHRLGVQAFEPVLIEGKAIQLHPLVCVAFNADFDGDQMAVHLPLSLEAQAEARVLMLSSNNILAPANGEPVILPTQDIVLGIYYATRERVGAIGEGKCFSGLHEVRTALAAGIVDLQARIKILIPQGVAEEGDQPQMDLVSTTVGRALMMSFLPKQMSFSLVNKALNKKDLGGLVKESFQKCGLRETVLFSDRLMRFGFEQATRAGVSICMQDMIVPEEKEEIIRQASERMEETKQQFEKGLLTHDERYNESIDVWHKAGEEVTRVMMENLSREPVCDATTGELVADKDGKVAMQESFNSLYMMADSGARGSRTQIKQLAGMRGLMTKPDGRIMETPITANFREGLSVLEYFLSTHGARKGLADTALKTANSGYLTRRLVDVAQDCVISRKDCGTKEGLSVRAVLMGGEVVVPISQRVLGRVLAQNVKSPQSDNLLYEAGQFIGEDEAKSIEDAGVDEVIVRSPVKCKELHGLCIKCYGRDLARGGVIKMGEAVGVIAAQSIGEPGTQLTMRTFHIGGAASREVVARSVKAETNGIMRLNARTIENSGGNLVVVSRGGDMSVHDVEGRERGRYRLKYGEVLRFKAGDKVEAGDTLSIRDPLTQPTISEYNGKVHIDGLEEGVNARRQIDEATGMDYWVVTEDKRSSSSKKTRSVQIKFLDESGKPVRVHGTETEVSIAVRPGATLEVTEGSIVHAGDVIARMAQEASKSRDITGGLPRVAELFEAREPKEPAILAGATGRVMFRRVLRGKQSLVIVGDDGVEHKIQVAKGRNILVQDGMSVEQGDEIVDGDTNPHEILAVRGVEALTSHIVDEVQSVYRLQGVNINDKHIEVIVRQMLRSVEVTDAGDGDCLVGDQMLLSMVLDRNKQLREAGLSSIRYRPILLGITKASLATESFISAASFQETTRVLTEAAISGRRDNLRGLKENVVVGRLIPAGTGAVHYAKLAREGNSETAEEIMRDGLAANEVAAGEAAAQ